MEVKLPVQIHKDYPPELVEYAFERFQDHIPAFGEDHSLVRFEYETLRANPARSNEAMPRYCRVRLDRGPSSLIKITGLERTETGWVATVVPPAPLVEIPFELKVRALIAHGPKPVLSIVTIDYSIVNDK